MPGSNPAGIPLGFGRMLASGGGRIAHFYRDKGQMLNVLGPYVAEGMRRGDHCIVASDKTAGNTLVRWLKSRGLIAKSPGKLNLIVPTFTQGAGRIQAQLDVALKRHQRPGSFVRLAWDCGSMASQQSDATDLLSFLSFYEDLSTSLGQDRLALSQLDLTSCRGDVVLDLLRVHGFCIMGEIPLRCSPDPTVMVVD